MLEYKQNQKTEIRTKMMSKPNETKSSSSSPRLDCDVGLGLKMQPSDSYYCDGGGFNFYGVADRSFQNTAFRGGMVGVYGKALFTASQWQELERQKIIYKYIMASIPVPPQLLLPTPSRSPPPLSQCNTSGLDLRFSSDPEPWRCKRTDGKKWRCSRDVAPDLKYCERHAHKSRPRSRKLVEVSSHKPASHYPSLSPASAYDQTRCIEWFMKGGSVTNSVSSTHKQQWDDKNTPFHHSNFEDKQNGFMTLNPYIPDTTNLHHNDQNSIVDDAKMKSLTQTTTTRHFIDAWEKEGYEGMSSKFPISPSSSSLSLSMCGGKGDLGIGMMNSDRESEGVLKPQWMMNSPPGGPLGEALCLGNATTTRGSLGSSSLAPPQGYGYCNTNPNTNTISSSICSKSSCEDGSYALNFIGDR